MEYNPQNYEGRAREILQNVGPQIEDARRSLSEINTRALGYIRQNPGTALLGAIAIGFIVGKLASRD